MIKIPHKDEAEVERRLIEVLGEGHNQWNYRPDLKSEEDLWKNLRQKITQNNLSEIGEHPISDKEFDNIKTELLSKTQTPFDAARWLKGENGIARITIEREDVSLGRCRWFCILTKTLVAESQLTKSFIRLRNKMQTLMVVIADLT